MNFYFQFWYHETIELQKEFYKKVETSSAAQRTIRFRRLAGDAGFKFLLGIVKHELLWPSFLLKKPNLSSLHLNFNQQSVRIQCRAMFHILPLAAGD